MKYYFLQDSEITEPKSADYKYIYYNKDLHNYATFMQRYVTLDIEPNIKYCMYPLEGKLMFVADDDDDIIDVTIHEGVIDSKFKKTVTSEGYELWINMIYL